MIRETGEWRLRPRDLLWGLAAPVYILVGTLRHEGSHALAGLAMGERIVEFVVWPTRIGWGYVRFMSNASWPVTAAPYVVDAIVFVVSGWLCRRIPERLHGLWVNVAVIGVASPAVDSIYNYLGIFYRGGDVAGLFPALGPFVVHGWFLVWSVAFVVGSLRVLRQPVRPGPDSAPGPPT